MSEQNEYEIERRNNVEYVVVRCGHLSRGMKVGEIMLLMRQIVRTLNAMHRGPL